MLYLGDTARQPYGPKPIGEVREYALECLDHLVDRGVKTLVIACNSASAAVLRDARERYPVPVVEVITRRPAGPSRRRRTGQRRRHLHRAPPQHSMAYDDAFAAAPHVKLFDPGLPALRRVRRGRRHRRAGAARRGPPVPRPADPEGVDTLILGCTHYPLLTGVISYVMGDEVTLVSSAEETAKDVYGLLVQRRSRASTRPCPSPSTGSSPPGSLASSATSAAASSARSWSRSPARPVRVGGRVTPHPVRPPGSCPPVRETR